MVSRIEVTDPQALRDLVQQTHEQELQAAAAACTPTITTPRTLSLTFGQHSTGEVHVHESRQFSSADLASSDAGGSVIGTATRNGFPVLGDVRESDIVTVNGMQMQVGMAVKLGLLNKTGQGIYQDAGLGKP